MKKENKTKTKTKVKKVVNPPAEMSFEELDQLMSTSTDSDEIDYLLDTVIIN